MRNRYIIILAVTSGVMALQGCNEGIIPSGPEDITIDASIGAMSRVSYDGNATAFTAGDRIAVYAWTGSASEIPADRVVDGVANTFDGSKWTPEKQMLWKTVRDAHYFMGVYPARKVTDFKADAFTLVPSDYQASDLLVATNLGGVTASGGAVALTFDHLMAKLVVNLNFRSQWDATPSVSSVTALARSSATVDYISETVTATGDAARVDIPAAPLAPAGYALSFSGLQIPQTGVRVITVLIDGQEFVYEAAADIPLEAGKYTTLGLNVGKDWMDLESVSVSDWTEEATLTGIEAVKDPGLSWEVEKRECSFTYDETPIAVKINRHVAKKTLEVPITLTDESGLFSLSTDKVLFNPGEYEKTVEISYTYSALVLKTEYVFTLSFDDSLCDAGSYRTFQGKGWKRIEYEDYKKGYYSGFYAVNTGVMAYEWIDGPIFSNLDSGEWILQKAKGLTGYYKMIIWDGCVELEFSIPSAYTIIIDKFNGYNDDWTERGDCLDGIWTFKGDSYKFELRPARCVAYCSGVELVEKDFIELEGWLKKNGSFDGIPGGGFNLYMDFDL